MLVSKGNVLISYNPVYEYAALPDVPRVLAALRQTITASMTRATVGPPARAVAAVPVAVPAPATPPPVTITIKMPIIGEGIRDARVVSLLKQPGDLVQPDEALCEVETEKAVYPIESAHAGVFAGWKVKVDETVLVGQAIGVLVPPGVDWQLAAPDAAEAAHPAALPAAAAHAPAPLPAAAAAMASRPGLAGVSLEEIGAPPGAVRREPVLSPAISRRLEPVIAATIELAIDWSAIRAARQTAKQRDPASAPSPSGMVAWAVAQIMVLHPPFRRLVLKDGQIVEVGDFELGVAVALEGDRLVTAVIPDANRLTWTEFHTAYARSIEEARLGRIVEVRAPLLISSLGGFGVRAGIPIVVPPSMGTLFIGTSYHEMVR